MSLPETLDHRSRLGDASPAPTSPRGDRVPLSTKRIRALQVFLVVLFFHVLEHAVQAVQVFTLRWPRTESLGLLGLVVPWLVKSETLHYFHAIATLVGLIAFRRLFTGAARGWWDAALAIQVWHHLEHLLLIGQWVVGQPWFGAEVPTSILQLWVPRVELHIFYNVAVLAPMAFAMMLDPSAWMARRRHRVQTAES